MALEASYVGQKVQNEDSVTAYTDIRQMKDLADSYQTFFGLHDRPASDLPNAVRDLLNKSTDGMGTGMYSYKQGFDDILKYLDDGKPSHVDDSTKQFQMGSAFVQQATDELNQAKQAVGLKN